MNRRKFAGLMAAGVVSPAFGRARQSAGGGAGCLTDVDGIKVGHFTDTRRPTGCTVILCENGAVGGVDVRGSAPGTRETDLLNPINMVERVHAIVLSGGSAFGLDSATGVMRYLEEQNIGFPVGVGKVPIVPAAILFDLGVGDWKIRPDAEAGYKAAKAAKTGPFEEGNVGAGAGATVGKMGQRGTAMKGGLGSASIRAGRNIVVAAIVAVNCVGDVIDPRTGKIVAGARRTDGRGFADTVQLLRNGTGVEAPAGQNTTIGFVATNAALTKTQMSKVAQMAHDGMARAINPVHTPSDGDTIFALSTGTTTVKANLSAIGALAAEAMAEAIVRAVRAAKSIPGYPSASDFKI